MVVPIPFRRMPTSLAILLAVSAGPARAGEEPLAIEVREFAGGLTAPLAAAHPGDGSGRLFIVEQVGRIRIWRRGELAETPFLDISSKLIPLNPNFDERGLLGLAFHPSYAENGRFFVRYSAPGGTNHLQVLAEYRVSDDDPDRADPDSERVILEVDEPEFNHNGGTIAFGPDGMLYTSYGDGGGAGDQHGEIGNGQDIETLLGKIVRIDVDGDMPYGIPADNPFVGIPGRDEIWAYGLRNPWKFSFDRGGEQRLFCADVGQSAWEEVDLIVRGGNYGWRVMEGTHCYDPPVSCDPGGKILPIAEYGHDIGTSITGGYVYRGTRYPSLQGKYIFGDFSRPGFGGNGRLFYLVEDQPGVFSLHEFVTNGGPAPACADAGDANDDGKLDIGDPIYTLNALFADGPDIRPPSGAIPDACGFDPTDDALDCASYPACD